MLRALRSLHAKGLVTRREMPAAADPRLPPKILWAHADKIEETERRAKREKRRAQENRRRAQENNRHAEAEARTLEQDASRFADQMAKLAKVLGLLRSDHDHEVLAAVRQAEAIRRRLGLEWHDLLTEYEPRAYRRATTKAEMAETMRQAAARATGV